MKPTIWTAAAGRVPVLEQLKMRRPITEDEKAEARKRAEVTRLRIAADMRPFRRVRRRWE